MIRIILVEDSPTDAKLVRHTLERAGLAIEIERVDDAEGFADALAGEPCDVVICDWSMPRFSAPAALAAVKARGLDVPFIIVSGTVGEEAAVEAMRAGAHDYVIKDRLTRLPAVIERELRDRAERRKSESARQASEALFARLAASGIIGIVVGDNYGALYEANDTFLKLVGYSRAELEAGRVRWRELTPPESQAVTDRGVESLRKVGLCAPYEKEYVRKDGTRLPVMVGLASLEGERTLGFMIDLTAQKRAEAALVESQEQLRQAQKMEAIGRLAGGVAHDFNNMLSVILSYGLMMTDTLPVTDPMHDDAQEIVKAAERATALTRQLLLFSRQEIVKPRVLDLRERVANMHNMLERLLGEDVELVTHSADAIGHVRADPSHIEQVVMNLVVNARDAMPTGGKLTIELRAAGDRVVLAVTDTGIGMDRETQTRIFEPFYTTKGPGRGTGLGLSTVFGIVEQCGGSIRVKSELGAGTTFEVSLPRVDADVDRDPTATAEPSTLSGNETIMIVEDEAQVRNVARTILRDFGYRVIEVNDAAEALCYQGAVDLVITDLVMPQMSGTELAVQLGRERPALKILCMSGYTDDALVRHGLAESGVAFLQKPITPAALIRQVRAVLDQEVTPRVASVGDNRT
jgi:two-component system cell cycle sensor histidine kinase/response regulator CckA